MRVGIAVAALMLALSACGGTETVTDVQTAAITMETTTSSTVVAPATTVVELANLTSVDGIPIQVPAAALTSASNKVSGAWPLPATFTEPTVVNVEPGRVVFRFNVTEFDDTVSVRVETSATSDGWMSTW